MQKRSFIIPKCILILGLKNPKWSQIFKVQGLGFQFGEGLRLFFNHRKELWNVIQQNGVTWTQKSTCIKYYGYHNTFTILECLGQFFFFHFNFPITNFLRIWFFLKEKKKISTYYSTYSIYIGTYADKLDPNNQLWSVKVLIGTPCYNNSIGISCISYVFSLLFTPLSPWQILCSFSLN